MASGGAATLQTRSLPSGIRIACRAIGSGVKGVGEVKGTVSRRVLLAGGLASGAYFAGSGAAVAAPTNLDTLPNWPKAERRDYTIEGSDLSLSLTNGPAAAALLHVARQLFYHTTLLDSQDIVSTAPAWARHPGVRLLESGVAFLVKGQAFSPGVVSVLTEGELIVVDDALADCEGVIGWGGDLHNPWAGFFYAKAESKNRKYVEFERELWDRRFTPSRTGGALDPFVASRRRAALEFKKTRRR